MATPPTFVAVYSSGYAQSAADLTAVVTTAVDDVIIVKATTEDGSKTLTTPTGGTGLTWTLQQSYTASSDVGLYVWTAVATAVNTGVTISVPRGSSSWAGMTVNRWSGSDGVGLSNKAQSATGTPSVAVTCSDNSALECIAGDWAAVDGTTRTWLTINSITPTSGNGFETSYDRNASFGTAYEAYWGDVGAAGSKTAGLSAPAGMQWSTAAVEILGAAGGPANWTRSGDDVLTTEDITRVQIIPGFDRMSWDIRTIRG